MITKYNVCSGNFPCVGTPHVREKAQRDNHIFKGKDENFFLL